jgi:hypothetical protein
MGADAVGPDQGSGGSGVGARLIAEEPMVRFNQLFTLRLLNRLYLVNSYESGHVAYVIYLSYLIQPP